MTHWLLWTIGAALALTGLLVTLRALFADRPRGRKRCPKCWYDMSGVIPSENPAEAWPQPIQCPECGRRAARERELRRTRRRRGWTAAGLVAILLGVAVGSAPRFVDKTPIDVLPRPVLVLFYRTFDDDRRQQTYGRFVKEIHELSQSQRRALGRMWAERYVSASLTAKPGAGQGPTPGLTLQQLINLPARWNPFDALNTAQLFTVLGTDMTPGIEDLIAAMPSLPGQGAEAFQFLAAYAGADPAFRKHCLERIRSAGPKEVAHTFFAIHPDGEVLDAIAARVQRDPACVRPMLAAIDDARTLAWESLGDFPSPWELIEAILRAPDGRELLIASFDAIPEGALIDLEEQALSAPKQHARLLELLLESKQPMIVLVAVAQDPPVRGSEEALRGLLATERAPRFAPVLETLLNSRLWLQDLGGPDWWANAPDLTRRILREARDPEARKVCLRAIRKLPGDFPDATALAGHVLNYDPDASVRLEAARLCADLSPTDEIDEIARKAAHSDPDTLVRTLLRSHLEQRGLWP